MKYRGANYERAIQELKALQAATRISGRKSGTNDRYTHAMRKVCRKFSVSVKTVYRDMRKRVPGLRKTRKDSGTVRSHIAPSTKKKAEELMKAGHTRADVKKRLGLSEKKLQRMRRQKSEPSAPAPTKTMFGQEAKKFFEKIFDYDLIAPDRGIPLRQNGVSFTVSKEDLKDIILILANAYNRGCFANDKKLKADRSELRSAMMHHLVEEQMRLAQESADYKLVEALTRMLDRLNEEAQLPGDFETLEKVCKELKPDIARAEIIALLKKVSHLE